jgi:hypothetical protein
MACFIQQFGCTAAAHPALLPPGHDPWLRIDYGRETAIAKVVVTNRIDCCRPVLTTLPNHITISPFRWSEYMVVSNHIFLCCHHFMLL